MNADYGGLRLDRLGMQIDALLGPGLMGHRWSIGLIEQPQSEQPFAKVIEIVEVTTPLIENKCDHMTSLIGQTSARGLAHIIATEWISDQHFAVVLDLSPKAISLKSVLAHPECRLTSEKDFWAFAGQLFRAITQFQCHGYVHGAIAPASVMIDFDSLILDGFWWSTNLHEQRPYDACLRVAKSSVSPAVVNFLPEELSEFAAPEVLSGERPTSASDLYSFGAVLKQLILLQSRMTNNDNGRLDVATDATNPLIDLKGCDQLVADLMATDPRSRLAHFDLERRVHEKLLSFVDGPWPSTWKFEIVPELQIGLSIVPANQVVTIVDVYQAYGHIHMHCRHETGKAWLTVQGFFRIGPKTYFALAHSPDLTDRCEQLPFMAACMLDDWHFRPVSTLEFSSTKEGLTENITRGTGDDLEYAQFLLGPLARRESLNSNRDHMLRLCD